MNDRIGRVVCLAVLTLFPIQGVALAQSLLEPGCMRNDDPLLTAGVGVGTGGDPIRLRDTDGALNDGRLQRLARAGDNCGGPLASDSSVYLFSGEFMHTAVDLRIPGRGFDFVWGRKYRSRIGPNALLGQNWDYSYNIHLEEIVQGPSQVNYLRFHDNDTMEWDAPVFPAGDPGDLNYCTWRSLDDQDFLTSPTVLDPEDTDRITVDPAVPGSGDVHYYLITPKNGTRQGDLGPKTAGLRSVLDCGLVGPELVLHDGRARDDHYRLVAPNLWNAPEFFRDLVQNAGLDYTLTFPDSGQWNFHPFAGNPDDGKISSIVDRNGNQMDFLYDAAGRLDQVVDTLGRTIQIGYNANGFLDNVTDFGGRAVQYDYYPFGDPNGSFGDLRSVTTPVVVGTPTGNDFPAGKTTGYTYSTGFALGELNSNLLTITDPKGQVILVNTYAPTTNPADLEFDRVMTQNWGHPGEQVDYFYRQEVANAANNFAVMRAIENDRMGFVTEYFYDDHNRAVMVQDYTGQANRLLQTTDVLNRPGLPLRAGDPPLFETRYTYDPVESLVVEIAHPNQNTELFVYDPASPFRRSQGNLREHCTLPGPLGGDQPDICELFEYDSGVGGTTGSNFVTRHTDGRANDTLHVYDADGNRLQTTHRLPTIVEDFTYNAFGQMLTHELPDNGSGVRRLDEYSYHAAGPQTGYLQSTNVDALGFALLTAYEYDVYGNMIRLVDPKGNDTLFDVNALNQVVREISRDVTPASGNRYEKDLYYDFNDNVVRVDTLNKDETGLVLPNSHFTTVYEYDILDRRTRQCSEFGSYAGAIPGPIHLPTCGALPLGDFVIEEFEYDFNRNLILIRHGEATTGAQPDNITTHLYDERDLLFQTARATGSPDQSTDLFVYDGNRNVVRVDDGIDAGSPHVTQYTYDGYDRLTRTIDPMGNEQIRNYDANGNVVRSQTDGELVDVPGSAGNIRLEERGLNYDPMDRPIDEIRQYFDPVTQLPILGGTSSRNFDWSDNSQLILATDALGNPTITEYDSASRVLRIIDPKLNESGFTYDPNGNVITETSREKHDNGNPDDLFVTSYAYDGLDRRIRTIDNVGNTTERFYDSRDNLVETQDAKRPTAADPGNRVRYKYDGLNRLTATTRFLTTTGTGVGAPAGTITTQDLWDASSRRVQQIDDGGWTTQYEYDPLNRRIRTIRADSTVEEKVYDIYDNITRTTDANGTVVIRNYDELDRNVARTVAPAPGVGGTTFELYEYDGLSRLVKAEDDDSVVEREYDSLGNITREVQNGRVVQMEYDEQGNKRTLVYPGGRVVEFQYDGLNRIIQVDDPGVGPFAGYGYVGFNRVEERFYNNGVVSFYNYDGIVNPPGDFGLKQKVDTVHDHPGLGIQIDHYVHRYDQMGNRVHRSDANPGGSNLVLNYAYDSIYRLRDTQHSIFGGAPALTSYQLDGLGSRLNVVGGPDPGGYFLDPTFPAPADEHMSQYTQTSFDAREYDDNGNLVRVDNGLPTQRNLGYDYRNQLIQFQDTATGLFAEYEYDAMGRRIVRRVLGGPPLDQRYAYDGRLLIEEEDNPSGTILANYIYGASDERILMERVGNLFFYQEDAQHSVISLTENAGNPVERYVYEDYGEPLLFNAAFVPILNSAVQNPYLFQGLRFDFESGLYMDDRFILDPRAGVSVTDGFTDVRIPGGSLGNGNTVFLDNPASGSALVFDEKAERSKPCRIETFHVVVIGGLQEKAAYCYTQDARVGNDASVLRSDTSGTADCVTDRFGQDNDATVFLWESDGTGARGRSGSNGSIMATVPEGTYTLGSTTTGLCLPLPGAVYVWGPPVLGPVILPPVGGPIGLPGPLGTTSTALPIPPAPVLTGLDLMIQGLFLDPGSTKGVKPARKVGSIRGSGK